MNGENKAGVHSEPYFQGSEFDMNQVDRILQLLVLKSRCLRQDNALRLDFNYGGYATTFFWQMALAIDNLLLMQVNDEVAACLIERGPMRALVEKVIDAARAKAIAIPQLAINDFSDLFQNRSKYIIGSCSLDFIVGTYSVFEMFMERIYEQLRPLHPSSGKQERRITALIDKYNKAAPEAKEKALRCIIKEGGDYVSGAEKVEFVMSKLPTAAYTRDIIADRRTIEFYRNARNSIHNLGKSASSKDFRLPTADADITLLSGKALHTQDYSDIIRLCGDIVEIYLAVLMALMAHADLGMEAFIANQ